MNESKEQPNWLLEQYNQLCHRDRTDGEIFWNKIIVLISINFALFSILSLTKEPLDLAFVIIIIFSGLFFTLFWWFVISRQAKWVDYWKKEIIKIEKRRGFEIKIQTNGNKFNSSLNYLEIGSYRWVSHILPVFFAVLWIVTLFYILLK